MSRIGPSTSNAALSDVLAAIASSPESVLKGNRELVTDALIEAANRFEEMSYADSEGESIDHESYKGE